MLDRLKEYISARIIRYLAQPTRRYAPFFAPDPEMTRRSLEPGDVVLIEGNTRLSAIIKFLTQSTWSHAALYVGERPGDRGPGHAAAADLGPSLPRLLQGADRDEEEDRRCRPHAGGRQGGARLAAGGEVGGAAVDHRIFAI